MSTTDDLKIEFNTRFIELKRVTEKYLGWSEDFTKDQASRGLVPFKTFKLTKSNKAPWLVDAIDLANFIEKVKLST
jgi:hypothetical protein